MKKAIIAFIAMLMFNCGPEQGERTLYTYTIKNDSGKNITIKAYRINRPDIAPVITNLPIGAKLTKTYQDGLPPTGYNFIDYFQGDSIIVKYENLKTQKYDVYDGLKCDQNPLFKSPFCERSSPEITFIFTVQDYEDAQDCNGNCD
jgi:hypothetical protein